MKAGKRNLLAVLAALAVAATLPASASAVVASPLRGVFLKEYSKPMYTMNQGDVLAFVNDDPFFEHGVQGTLAAPVVASGGSRLVRGASSLGPGSYAFSCPVHPEMTSTLMVTDLGSPLPPETTPPSAGIRVVRAKAKKVIAAEAIQLRVRPSEPLEAEAALKLGGKPIGTSATAFPGGNGGTVTVPLDDAGLKRVTRALQGRGATVTARVKITDVFGNAGRTQKKSGRLGGLSKGKTAK